MESHMDEFGSFEMDRTRVVVIWTERFVQEYWRKRYINLLIALNANVEESFEYLFMNGMEPCGFV